MSILSIDRDQGISVSIVRATCNDTIASASAVGYLTAQAANIATVNSGEFHFLSNDEVLLTCSDGNAFFQVSADRTTLLPAGSVNSVKLGITALSGGGQTGAPVLINGFNQITVVAASGDSVQLPADVLGQTVVVTNASTTNPANVFPSLGDTINALSANASLAVAAGATTVFYGITTTNWHSK